MATLPSTDVPAGLSGESKELVWEPGFQSWHVAFRPLSGSGLNKHVRIRFWVKRLSGSTPFRFKSHTLADEIQNSGGGTNSEGSMRGQPLPLTGVWQQVEFWQATDSFNRFTSFSIYPEARLTSEERVSVFGWEAAECGDAPPAT
jgi:hypothetical protein